MKGCNPAFTLGAGPKLSLNQPENILLGEESKRLCQSIVSAAMYLEQVSRYDILYAVNQLARGISKTSKAHGEAVKHMVCYLAGSADLSITYKQGRLKLAVFSEANRGNKTPDNGKSASSCTMMLANGPIRL